MDSFAWELSNLLNAGINVLVYYGNRYIFRQLTIEGDLDLVCPWNGGLNWMVHTPWTGQDAFGRAQIHKWDLDGKAVGEFKQFGNFQYLKVYDAGHMTPTDQPRVSLELFTNFLYHIPFGTTQ